METEKDLRKMLKSGHIIETRGGELGLVVETNLGLLIQFENTWGSFVSYDETLLNTNSPNSDIMTIREVFQSYHVIRKDLKSAPIIWRRSDMVKEYTLDQVLKMAGLEKASVKIIG